MNDSDLDIYYQKGGSYLIPVEIINQITGELADTKQENESLKKHLEIPETCNLKTLEDYKSYYEDATKEQILSDTYIDYRAYVNLAHRYSELKKELEIRNELVAQGTLTEMKLRDENRRLRKEYQDTYKDVRIEIKEYKNQQKEFAKYLNKAIETLECYNTNDEELKGYLLQRVDTFKEILSKYKEIIGEENETRFN